MILNLFSTIETGRELKTFSECPMYGGRSMSDDAEISTRRLRLKMALEELREMKGFGTELVTIITVSYTHLTLPTKRIV